tara:strand:- start:121 stop:354 length:234 start_codon:yes stop_codon:yes gene_type:complete
MRIIDLLTELKSFEAAGVRHTDIMNAENSTATTESHAGFRDLLEGWTSGEFDEDPGRLVDELNSIVEKEFFKSLKLK